MSKSIDSNKNRGVVPKSALYSYLSKYSKKAINSLIHLMNNTSNDSVKLGCIRLLLDKTVADVKPIDEPVYDRELVIHIVEEKKENNIPQVNNEQTNY